MSAKKAKQIRRLTKAIIAMQQAQGTEIAVDTLYVEVQKNRKMGLVPGMKLGTEGSQQVISAGTILTTTSSQRGIYVALKKKLGKSSAPLESFMSSEVK
jgi:hypothetical protein